MEICKNVLITALSLFSISSFSQIPSEIEDVNVYGINKLPARTMVWPGSTLQLAERSTYDTNEWVTSLNGNWSFHWVPEPSIRPVDFYKMDFDISGWKTIPVPSTMERQGYGTAIYTNSVYPFKVDPPRVMGEPNKSFTTYKERNPVGSFRREFEVPADWKNKQLILHFAGVSSAMFVWVNGQKVGYSEDSRLPADFNITNYVSPKGKNIVAVEVYKYSDGSYLEDQDYWDVIYAYPQLAGGFVWDWVDQSLYKNLPNGKKGHLYGGDFGDKPNDGNFMINGLITSDRTKNPHYEELRKVYQPVAIRLIDKETIEIKNYELTGNLNNYVFSYEVLEDGKPASSGILPAVDKWITPYVRPQENANRTEMRWLKIGKADGFQIIADSTSTFSASAWPYTQQTLENSTHDYLLVNHKNTTLNIDCIQMGVGGDNSWGMPVHDQYMIYPGKYSLVFYIQ